MKTLATLVIVTALVTASTAEAKKAKTISTPSLYVPSDYHLLCTVANTSTANTVEVVATIYGTDDNVFTTGAPTILEPTESAFILTEGVALVGHCVAEIISGKPTDIRVSLSALNEQVKPVAAVPGY